MILHFENETYIFSDLPLSTTTPLELKVLYKRPSIPTQRIIKSLGLWPEWLGHAAEKLESDNIYEVCKALANGLASELAKNGFPEILAKLETADFQVDIHSGRLYDRGEIEGEEYVDTYSISLLAKDNHGNKVYFVNSSSHFFLETPNGKYCMFLD